jgi:RHS repeat-associated protein
MNDAWSNVIGSKHIIGDDWQMIEIEWKRASAPGANDGLFSLWIDETLVETLAFMDNDASYNTLDEVRLGATGGIDSTTSGSVYFDGFVSRRETYIGSGSTTPTATPTPLPSSGTVTIPIATGNDDVEENNTGWMYFDSSDLELVTDGTTQKIGMRFTGMNLPQGATILNAYIQFTAEGTGSEMTSLMVQAEAADNSVNFSESGKVSIRPRTASSVLWEPIAWSTLDESGPNQRTPDLSAVIQEIVNRQGWMPGNAISVLITGTGKRVAVSYEGNASQAPYLVVEYTTEPVSTPTAIPSETPTPTPTETPIPEPTPTETFTPTPTPLSYLPESLRLVSLDLPAFPLIRSDYYNSEQQSTMVTTTIDYDYDPLYRLTNATYSNGNSYTYTYDASGNRLTQDSTINGIPSTVNYEYDDANRLSTVNSATTYTFDANGNLLGDGANTYTYDFANRLVSVFTSETPISTYQYNGLGDRLSENGTQYTLDLNTGLTQVLSDGTTDYLYGNGRIAQVNTSTEYFLADALGSVRQMTNSTGDYVYAQSYDPYGVVTYTAGTSRTEFGFTGEQYGDSTQLLFLRARYYNPADGRFQSRDTWAGDVNRPLSLNRWMYVEGNPVNLTDPSGYFPSYCQSMPTKGLYEYCVLSYYQLEPISYFEMGKTIQGERGCYSGPEAYRAPGYLEGVGLWALIHRGGYEVVYDFARMERMEFNYYGNGANDAVDFGIGGMFYSGKVTGFRSDQGIIDLYRGLSSSFSIGPSGDIGFGVGAGKGGFVSWTDIRLRGNYYYVGASFSADLAEFIDIDITLWSIYNPMSNNPTVYSINGTVNRARLFTDILTGKGSPWGIRYPSITQPSQNIMLASRAYGTFLAMKYATAFEEIRSEKYK